jgi:signal transduction histidine kinase
MATKITARPGSARAKSNPSAEELEHDFNNLMAAIIGYSSLLLINPLLPKPLRTDIEKIQSAASSATELVPRLSRRRTRTVVHRALHTRS